MPPVTTMAGGIGSNPAQLLKGTKMKYLIIAMTAAGILLAAQSATAGRTTCTTYGNRTQCNYTPECKMIFTSKGMRQVCG